MTLSRRSFVAGVAAVSLAAPRSLAATRSADPTPDPAVGGLGEGPPPDRFDPWLEIDPSALVTNAGIVSRLAGGRPILAVIKNNAYGLGLTQVAHILEPLESIAGFAVVKAAAALALREAGVRKPVLLMGLFSDEDGPELVAKDIHLSLCTDEAASWAVRAAERAGKPAVAHVYLDTGMSRMGIPYHRALPVLEATAALPVRIDGMFMGFTEEPEFDREQLRRFTELAAQARGRGVALGALHAASSNGVFHLPEAHLDMVRPGIALFGAYPSDWEAERAMAELVPAVRLRARVVRVERLSAGDTVSYGRSYEASEPTWIATIPVGHADGYTRKAVNGAQVLIGDRLYPVIGAVSASHTIIEVGHDRTLDIGDVATLVGPDDPAIHPNALAAATGTSVYDVLMHLNPGLPKVLV